MILQYSFLMLDFVVVAGGKKWIIHQTIQFGAAEVPEQKQPFDYLLVLDFEATCWSSREVKGFHSEIIEFPCVLYDVKNKRVLEEFQQYVMPTEHPKLSDFCIELTGITQKQVDDGVPLLYCLRKFLRWLDKIKKYYNMEFVTGYTMGKNICTFATWSDWDLGICFIRECISKHIQIPNFFKKWIDVRTLFIAYYRTTSFKGLCGALQLVGLSFEGQEHCGLDDARNTARLVGRMIQNGAVLELTTN